MSLTYQPFAEMPEIETLSHELHMNVPDDERLLSGLAGIGLVLTALCRAGSGKWLLLGFGGALLRRAVSGECPLYRHLNWDRRHHRPSTVQDFDGV